jgi:inosose dehydratase
MVETKDDVLRVLQGSAIPFCLDTGHLLIGGTDPVEIARRWAGRVAHVHAKDVNLALAKQVQDGRLSYQQAVAQGIYVPLGTGDVDFTTIVGKLNEAGFAGWYVMEQDTILASEPADEGPLQAVRQSIAYLKTLAS